MHQSVKKVAIENKMIQTAKKIRKVMKNQNTMILSIK